VDNIWFQSGLWIALALASSVLSIWITISVALVEIVVGAVAGNVIGLPLNAAITTLAWTKVSLILLIIIATVIVSEWVSAKVRHTII